MQTEADPAAFAVRGAIVAFTTPQLFGARLGLKRAGAPPELILANLSGHAAGKTHLLGDQVLTIPELTAHDQALWQKFVDSWMA